MIKSILKSLLIVIAFPLSLSAFTHEPFDVINFTILHTSDIHAHLQVFDGPTGNSVGGYARIKKYKDTLEERGHEVLMLSSGDVFQGTFFYRFFQGIPDMEFMNHTGYAAMTLGNHEFDNGQEALSEALSYAMFPVLAANIEYKKIPQLQKRIRPYTFLQVGKEGRKVKIAVIGLVPEELKSIVQPVFVKDFDVRDAISTLRRYLPEVKKAQPDMILVLSHLGWDKEVELFELFPEIDGVLGGHTHLSINPPPVVNGPNGHRFISQPGEWGQHITRYDISFYPDSRRQVEVTAAGLVHMSSDLPEDKKMAAKIQKLWEQIQVKVNVPLGLAEVFLNGERQYVRNIETNLGNFVADCFSEIVPADMALINGGGIRSSIATGTITVGSCLNVLPFDDYLVKLSLHGSSIKKIFNQVAAEMNVAGGFGGFLQVSRGLQVDYSQGELKVKFNGRDIEDDKVYTVTTNEFLASGGNGLTAFTEAINTESTGKMTADALMKYVKSKQNINAQVEDRIKVKSTVKKVKMPLGIIKTVPAPPR